MGQTRWLSAGEQQVWRSYLTATTVLSDVLDRQLTRDSGVPLGYYEILVRLSEAPGHTLRMSQLADASSSSRSRLSHAVARLEERGWVRRESCPTDKRGQLAILTADGYAALEAAAPGHVECVRASLFDALSPAQAAALGGICRSLVEHLAEQGAEGCAGGEWAGCGDAPA